MEKKHKCKICSRKFSSGKAMGGHMRSHLRTLPLPPKTPPQNHSSGGGGLSESNLSMNLTNKQLDNSSLVTEDVEDHRPEGSEKYLDDGSAVHDRESETESTIKPTTRMRRSKRVRRTMFVAEFEEKCSAEFEPVSSFSDSSPEEDIAICLMMLSNDVWSDRSNYTLDVTDTRQSNKYRCEICNKVLKSSQALGSHKTIHKRMSVENDNENESGIKAPGRKLRVIEVEHKVHECPFCGKIYGSGQALGGHKRSHILGLSTTASSSSKAGDSLVDSGSGSGKLQNQIIDLNMPAPIEDEEFTQAELSAVS